MVKTRVLMCIAALPLLAFAQETSPPAAQGAKADKIFAPTDSKTPRRDPPPVVLRPSRSPYGSQTDAASDASGESISMSDSTKSLPTIPIEYQGSANPKPEGVPPKVDTSVACRARETVSQGSSPPTGCVPQK